MSNQGGGWFTTSEWIEIWIGVATTISAIVAVLTYRLAKGGFFLSLPHVTGRAQSSTHPNFVWLSIAGPHADQWEIATVTVVSPRSVHFLRRIDFRDNYGGGDWKEGEPIGRKINYRDSPVVLSSLETPVKLRIRLSLKALPSVTSRRTTIINKID